MTKVAWPSKREDLIFCWSVRVICFLDTTWLIDMHLLCWISWVNIIYEHRCFLPLSYTSV